MNLRIGFVTFFTAVLLSPAIVCAQATLGLQNTEFTVKLPSFLRTRGAKPGDTFTAVVTTPDIFQGGELAGKVSRVSRSTKPGAKSELSFSFETLAVNGRSYSILADLKEVSNSLGVKEVDEKGRAIGRTSVIKKPMTGIIIGTLLTEGMRATLGGGKANEKGAVSPPAPEAGGGSLAGGFFSLTLTTTGGDIEFGPGLQFVLLVSDRQ